MALTLQLKNSSFMRLVFPTLPFTTRSTCDLHHLPSVTQDDGTCATTLPVAVHMHAMAVADGAHIVLAVFQNLQGYLGKKIGVSGDKKTIAECAAIISRVTGNAILW